MATATAKRPARVHCDADGCTYSVEVGQEASLEPHRAMAHGSSRNDDELTCVGSNHVPGCLHLTPAPARSPSLTGATLLEIPLDLVDVGDNVRVTLEAIDELAASIVEHGVLQPVKATRTADGRYRLLWGQRRVLAARQAGLATIPALVTTEDSDERPIEQLVENLHRADLNPIDRAQAMRAVVDAGVSQADLARKLGIAPSTVANDLRILEAAPEVVELVRDGTISPAHAKAVLGLPKDDQVRLAERGKASGYSAHQCESDAKYLRERQADLEKNTKRTATVARHVVEALRKAEVPLTAEVRVSVPYNVDQAPVIAAAVEAGWTNARTGWGSKARDCGCEAWIVEASDYKGEPDVRQTCISNEHQAAARTAATVEREARSKREAEERNALELALRASVAAIPPTLGRLLVRWFDNYGGKTWTEYLALADDDVAASLAARIAMPHGSKPIPVAKVVEALEAERPA